MEAAKANPPWPSLSRNPSRPASRTFVWWSSPGDQDAYRAAAGPHGRLLKFVEQARPLGYGHAVWCARGVHRVLALPAAGGRSPLHQPECETLRATTGRNGRRRGLHRLGCAGHARKQAALLWHGGRPAGRRTPGTLSGVGGVGKAHAHRGGADAHRARFAGRAITSVISACTS